MSEREIRGSRRFRDFEKPKVEERFDFADLVRRQIERCLISSSDPEFMFPSAVQALEALLPHELKDDQYQNDFEMAETTAPVLVFRKMGGTRLGTQKKPCLRDRREEVLLLEDGSIDWSNPNILSPKLKEKTTIDYYVRFEAAFNQFVRLGVAVRRISRG